MSQKFLGKISSFRIGNTGYQNCQFGLDISFDFTGRGITTTIIADDSRDASVEFVEKLQSILSDSKKESIDQLIGVPVELTIENQRLQFWRVLKEVL